MGLVNVVSHGDWVEVILNRPEKRNALSPELVQELKQVVAELRQDAAVKAVVFAGAGKAFSAGADLAYLQALSKFSEEENQQDVAALSELFQAIYTLPKITVARVNGPALAGGCGLVTLMDFVFAAQQAIFGYTEARIGFVPALVANYLLRKVSGSVATELLLFARILTAEEAHKIGLVHRVVADDALNETVAQFVEDLLAQNSFQAMVLTKQLLRDIQEQPLNRGLEIAAEVNVAARKTSDCQRGLAAFLNKQKVNWRES